METNRSCKCNECIVACKRAPGVFAPREAEDAAEFLKIPFDVFKENLVLNYHSDPRYDPMFWQPKKKHRDHLIDFNGVASDEWTNTPGTCVFLTEDNGCSIHEVKPYECRESFICEKPFYVWSNDHLGKYKKKT